jgi:hypothetical protein
LFRVFTVLTLARNSNVMSTAIANCTRGPAQARSRQQPATPARTWPPEDCFRLCTLPCGNGNSGRIVPVSAWRPRREEKGSGFTRRAG